MCITNNHTLFCLWWKKSLVKHQEVSKYCDHDCKLFVSCCRKCSSNVKKCYGKKISPTKIWYVFHRVVWACKGSLSRNWHDGEIQLKYLECNIYYENNALQAIKQYKLAQSLYRKYNLTSVDYRFRKDEIFKRMKASTFAQLVSDTLQSTWNYLIFLRDCR